jgi:hypothetical protein
MRPIARFLPFLLVPAALLTAGPLPPTTPPPENDGAASGDVIGPEFLVDPMADGLYSTYLRLHERLKENLNRSARNESLLRALAARETPALDQAVTRQPASADPASVPPPETETDATVFWTTLGNAAPKGRPLFLGTLDRSTLSLGAGGRIALRIQGPAESPNLLGGHAANLALPGVVGGVIGGGGSALSPNSLRADYGVVGGGLFNQAGGSAGFLDSRFATVGGGTGNRAEGSASTIGGGTRNLTLAKNSTVGGGQENLATQDFSTIAGGQRGAASALYASIGGGNTNVVSGRAGTVAGGEHNQATAAGAFIGGGLHNTASGQYAIVPGGSLNLAAGAGSFAAGSMAQALHDGSFVWADRQDLSFASTTNHQFLVRAAGNMGLDTATPGEKLTVRGNIAPADTRVHDLGSSALVWNRLYLHEGILTPNGFAVTREGQALLTLTPSGDLRIPGKLIAAGVENPHGEALGLGVPAAAAPALPDYFEPARIRGGALTESTVFGGQVTGTRGALKLQPASVDADMLAPDSVHAGHLRANTLTTRHVVDGSLRIEDIDLSGFDQRFLALEGGAIKGRLEVPDDQFQIGERQLVARSGRIGIGTVQPEEALTVAGTIHSSKGGFRFPDGSVQERAWVGQENSEALVVLRAELAEIQKALKEQPNVPLSVVVSELTALRKQVNEQPAVPLAAMARSVSNQWQRLELLEQSLRKLPAGGTAEDAGLRAEVAGLREALDNLPPAKDWSGRLGQLDAKIESLAPMAQDLPRLQARADQLAERLAGLQGLSNEVAKLLVQGATLDARLGLMPDQWRVLDQRVSALSGQVEKILAQPVAAATPVATALPAPTTVASPVPTPQPWSPPADLLALRDRLPELQAAVAATLEKQAAVENSGLELAGQVADLRTRLGALPPPANLKPLEQAAVELRKANEETREGLAQLNALWEERLGRELAAREEKLKAMDLAAVDAVKRLQALEASLATLGASPPGGRRPRRRRQRGMAQALGNLASGTQGAHGRDRGLEATRDRLGPRHQRTHGVPGGLARGARQAGRRPSQGMERRREGPGRHRRRPGRSARGTGGQGRPTAGSVDTGRGRPARRSRQGDRGRQGPGGAARGTSGPLGKRPARGGKPGPSGRGRILAQRTPRRRRRSEVAARADRNLEDANPARRRPASLGGQGDRPAGGSDPGRRRHANHAALARHAARANHRRHQPTARRHPRHALGPGRSPQGGTQSPAQRLARANAPLGKPGSGVQGPRAGPGPRAGATRRAAARERGLRGHQRCPGPLRHRQPTERLPGRL